ncbi:IclR family transcriptional regulator [Heyndrickxia shackletonii]|uniref:Glycerol operon regulatory protein n=1 Tax=Heyndrickxia shackletonii TaxID=157838 RepID=A0A0Q3WST1_9BACI|nr:IclR family transcriptional regulator [Heyndrickxia shackletonii]KQL50663.1 IclR family transcriptional regulator [Heyndrickxia shackletonii]NEY98010.1 IclR family transcriptional regulator [Heyndrickxia shackletonii]
MNQSIIKALSLLDLFSDGRQELSLKEITEEAKLPKPTVYRLLASLEYSGFITKTKETENDSRYKLGLKLLELGSLVSEQLELRKIALPHMKKLAGQLNEVVHLVISHQNEAVYIEKVESTRALRLHTRIGKRSPLYLGSGPKLLLAFMEDNRKKLVMEEIIQYRKIEKHSLLEDLQQIKQRGYAISYGEQDVGTVGISFPIYDYQGHVVASLAVSGPTSRFEGQNMDYIKEKTEVTAGNISQELGYKNERNRNLPF